MEEEPGDHGGEAAALEGDHIGLAAAAATLAGGQVARTAATSADPRTAAAGPVRSSAGLGSLARWARKHAAAPPVAALDRRPALVVELGEGRRRRTRRSPRSRSGGCSG